MIHIDLKSLVKKMTPQLTQALEGAAGLCVSQGQFNVEIEHWLIKILEQSDTDLKKAVQQFNANSTIITQQLNITTNCFRSGNNRAPSLSSTLVEAAKNAWMLCTLDFNQTPITSGHLLAALLLEENTRKQLFESSTELKKIKPESLREVIPSIVGTCEESKATTSESTKNDPSNNQTPSQTPALDKYTINLTSEAAAGSIDAVLGRDDEIRQCIDILSRRRQNNPILTGEAGVGKTAVVEGFALRIAKGDVPDSLKSVSLRALDLGLLQAGANIKGEFENRLKSVIEEVKASPQPIILFIDEAHSLIGAGGKEGQGDAANLLKPALARGELRTIAATTWAEYKKYFERDPALTRRFQVIKVEEPSETTAIDMMRGISKSLEKHHKVKISGAAIEASVRLSARYIPSRQLPDKSVSLLDTACARVALSQQATPVKIEDLKRRADQLSVNIKMLEAENAAKGTYDDQISGFESELSEIGDQLGCLETQYTEEKNLVEQIISIRRKIDVCFITSNDSQSSAIHDKDTLAQLQKNIHTLSDQLKALQQSTPLIYPEVTAHLVAEVIESWTGIPAGKMEKDSISNVLSLKDQLIQRVIGQDHALNAIAQSIQTSSAGLTDSRKPIGVFLMVGTSGVGKTETALALADTVFGGEQNLTTINMSEFKEEHKISMLLGSPPGYVGYGEGGVLTEAVRRKPYSVILLDEMEKAHHGIQDVFYNLFDKGIIKDGEGRDIDFKNTIIIMTSNAGEDAIRAICQQEEHLPEPDILLDNIRPQLLKHFKPAFLGRTQVITYYPLKDENLIEICKISMHRIERRIKETYKASFSYDEDVLIHIVARSQEVDTGARNIETILNKTLLPNLATACLYKLSQEEEITHIHIGVSETGQFIYSL